MLEARRCLSDPRTESKELNSLARSPTSFIPPLYRLDDYELLLGRYGAYFGR